MPTTTEQFVEFLQRRHTRDVKREGGVTDVLKAPTFPGLERRRGDELEQTEPDVEAVFGPRGLPPAEVLDSETGF